MARALRLSGAVEAAVGDGPARIYRERGVVYVEVPSPFPCAVPGSALRGRGLAVPLGLAARQTIAGIDFDQSPHALIIGPTGRGKTTAMRALAYHFARQNHAGKVGMLAITLKPTDWQSFGRLLHAWAVISDPKEHRPPCPGCGISCTGARHRVAACPISSPLLMIF
jgi:FtsK/SpoIIIE family